MSSNNVKLVIVPIITALIGAAAAVIVAFIGIVPQLRHQDFAQISSLQTKLKNTTTPATTSEGSFTITGTAFRQGSNVHTLSGVEIFLLPAEGNDLMSTTGDDGIFELRDVPSREWWIVFRNSNQKDEPSGRFLVKGINGADQKDIPGASISYRVASQN